MVDVQDSESTLAIVLRGEEIGSARSRLDQYQADRAALGLPLLQTQALEAGLRLEFKGLPGRWSPAETPDATNIALLTFLRQLEGSWGPLGEAFSLEEVRLDRQRSRFAVGPGLFRPHGTPEVLRALERALLAEHEPDLLGTAEDFSQLLAHLVSSRRELGELASGAAGVKSLIPTLRDAATAARRRGEPGNAQRLLAHALALAPGDRDLLRLLVKTRLKAGQEPSNTELEQLRSGLPLIWEDAYLVAACLHRRGDGAEAQRWATRAAEQAPKRMETWKQVAQIAKGNGDMQCLAGAVVELAALGDRAALSLLSSRKLGQSAFTAALDRFSGPEDAEVWQWRLDRLLKEERLARALQSVAARREWVATLPEGVLLSLVDAAERHGGPSRVADLARLLGQIRISAEPNPAVARALAETLHRLNDSRGLVALWQAAPRSFPRDWWLVALTNEKQWSELERVTRDWRDGELEDAYRRLWALVQLGLEAPSGSEKHAEIRPLLRCLGQNADARREVRERTRLLARIAPTAPVVTLLHEAQAEWRGQAT